MQSAPALGGPDRWFKGTGAHPPGRAHACASCGRLVAMSGHPVLARHARAGDTLSPCGFPSHPVVIRTPLAMRLVAFPDRACPRARRTAYIRCRRLDDRSRPDLRLLPPGTVAAHRAGPAGGPGRPVPARRNDLCGNAHGLTFIPPKQKAAARSGSLLLWSVNDHCRTLYSPSSVSSAEVASIIR